MDIFPTQHAPFGVEPVGSQQQEGEPCVREVVAGDTPACHGVQDPAVPGGESHNMGLPAPPWLCSKICQTQCTCKEVRVCCQAAPPAPLASGSGPCSWDSLFAEGSTLSDQPPARRWLRVRGSSGHQQPGAVSLPAVTCLWQRLEEIK